MKSKDAALKMKKLEFGPVETTSKGSYRTVAKTVFGEVELFTFRSNTWNLFIRGHALVAPCGSLEKAKDIANKRFRRLVMSSLDKDTR